MKNNSWLLWVLLIFLPPVGIIYMWITKKEFTSQKKGILSVIFTIWFIWIIVTGGNNTEDVSENISENQKTEAPASTNTATSVPATKKPENKNKEDSANTSVPKESTETIKPIDQSVALWTNFNLYERVLMNGSGTKSIGKYGYIELLPEEFSSINGEDLRAFAKNKVEGANYNYISIIDGEGNGICFVGCMTEIASYGKVDEYYAITEEKGVWTKEKDGNYSYEGHK